jgi:hypothetical protein
MSQWWVFRPGGVGTPIGAASQKANQDFVEGPIDDTINAELKAFLNPNPLPKIPFATFISRWTNTEYATLLQKRAQAVTAGNAALAQQWDQAAAANVVDLNTPAADNFKQAMVTNNILTSARADVIFG